MKTYLYLNEPATLQPATLLKGICTKWHPTETPKTNINSYTTQRNLHCTNIEYETLDTNLF